MLLVHHARKGAAHARAGQALRGSSELHAWGDSNLYLRRKGETLRLSIEHRAAPGADGLGVELRPKGRGLALRVAASVADAPPLATSLLDRVEQTLASAETPLTRDDLRRACSVRMTTLGEALAKLIVQGRVLKSSNGYRLAGRQEPVPVPLTL